MTNIYINSWRNYNTNGADGGEWYSLPLALTIEELQAIHGEELVIHDFETDVAGLVIHEGDDIQALSDLIEALEGADVELVSALMEDGYTLAQALEEAESGDSYLMSDCDSLADAAEQMAAEGLFSTEYLMRYIDWEALGRDLGFDGFTETKHGVLCSR